MRKSMRKANQALETAQRYISEADVKYKEELRQKELMEQQAHIRKAAEARERERQLQLQRQRELQDPSFKYKRKLQEYQSLNSIQDSPNFNSGSLSTSSQTSITSRYYDGRYIDSAIYEKVDKGNFKIILTIEGQKVELPKRFKSSTKAQDWITAHGLII